MIPPRLFLLIPEFRFRHSQPRHSFGFLNSGFVIPPPSRHSFGFLNSDFVIRPPLSCSLTLHLSATSTASICSPARCWAGRFESDRKSTKKGSGITFADYAEYHLGDDFRSIDWRVYARFEQLVVKLFEIDEDATVYILLDESHSMKSKFLFARQLGAALGYIALHMLDSCASMALRTN